MASSEIKLNSCSIRILDIQPDLLALAHHFPARYPHLLQSVAHGTAIARFDLLFAFPGEQLVLNHVAGDDFLDQFDRQFNLQQKEESQAQLYVPFFGGWFVYLGYELAQQIEPILQLPKIASGLPIAFATRFPAAIIWDHQQQKLLLVAEQGQTALLDKMEADVNACPALTDLPLEITAVTEDQPQNFIEGVEKIKQYIVEGDIFQVNLSRAWYAKIKHPSNDSSVALYQRLCQSNPAPFAALARHEGQAIISSSPERLVKQQNGVVEVRPIAGTRPRGQGLSQDEAKRKELIGHPKERAEHIMLIDLERNDLGRIAQPGSVEVNELMTLESYAHVHHIVSNVRAKIRDGITPSEIIRAVFPGGTITGCPKIRCMEIIAELEQCARGPYTGALGYINRNGSMDLNILIRTLHQFGEEITLRAGAGIVHDSQAEWELKESRQKARGLLLALGVKVDDIC